MTELLCVSGSLLDDGQASICIGGEQPSSACFSGNIVWQTGSAPSVIAAQITCAPSVNNPGGADPNTGTFTQLLDSPQTGLPPGGNKALLLSVHNITGGTGPYTVDFTQVQWSITYDAPYSYDVEVFWGLNMNFVSLTGSGGNSVAGGTGITQPSGSPLNSGAIVSGVGASDYASFGPRLTVPTVPYTPFSFSHQTVGGIVTVTDSLGASQSFPLTFCGSTWAVTGGGGGGGPLIL